MHLIPMISLRLPKFLVVGGFGAFCYFIFSFLLTFIGLRPWIASSIVYICLIPIIYSIQKKFVFESDEGHLKSFSRYLAIQFIGIGLSGFMPFVLDEFGFDPMFSFVCVTLLIAFISYMLQMSWAFKKTISKF